MTATEINATATPAQFDVTDALGRVITLKKPKPLQRLDFKKAIGAGTANGAVNMPYFMEVSSLEFVYAIDGVRIITPGSDAEVRALYEKLDEEGLEAVQEGVAQHFWADKLKQAGIEVELKNS